MLLQTSSLTAWFLSFSTSVKLLFGVSQNVIPQIVLILKDLLHYEQLCNFLPLWVSRWVLRFPVLLNDLLHCAHFCNISPLWMSRCFFRCWIWLNDLLHSEHLCNFFPLCVSWWVIRLPAILNDLLHFAHFSLHTMPTNCLTSDLKAIYGPGSHLCTSNLIYVTLCNSFSHVTDGWKVEEMQPMWLCLEDAIESDPNLWPTHSLVYPLTQSTHPLTGVTARSGVEW